jgi:hypothetical protein
MGDRDRLTPRRVAMGDRDGASAVPCVPLPVCSTRVFREGAGSAVNLSMSVVSRLQHPHRNLASIAEVDGYRDRYRRWIDNV